MAVDWKQISPKEFEEITRDLIGAHLGMRVESFGEGTDGGIDLRMDNGKIIVQCKRISGPFRELMSKLRKEKTKLDNQKFEKYMIVTTCHLSPMNKTQIMREFPKIFSTEDIYGADDLEGLLARYEHVRTLYPSLWLGDSELIRQHMASVCDRFIDNQTKYEYEKIVKAMNYMVRHPLYDNALKILKNERALIITGPPGIGKTSLAYNLIWDFTRNSNYEFVYVGSDIKEAEQKYAVEESQVFLYDDFLGSNFLRDRLNKNEDKGIYNFIEKIRSSRNKMAIFTTREYIFQQASREYRYIDDTKELKTKLVLEIKISDLMWKAKVLYKHLWVHKAPAEAIESLFKKQHRAHVYQSALMHVLKHESFNPRVVQRAVSKNTDAASPDTLADTLLDGFEHPFGVYEQAFNVELTQNQQRLLLVLASFPNGVKVDLLGITLEGVIHEYSDNPTLYCSDLQILEGDFIKSNLGYNDSIIIDFVNPGLRDFIYEYIRRCPSLFRILINSIRYASQAKHLYNLLQMNKPLSQLRIGFERELVDNSCKWIDKTIENGVSDADLIELACNIFYDVAEEYLFIIQKLLDNEASAGYSDLSEDSVDNYVELIKCVAVEKKLNVNLEGFFDAAFTSVHTLEIISILRDLVSDLEEHEIPFGDICFDADEWQQNYISIQEDTSVETEQIREEIYNLDKLIRLDPYGVFGFSYRTLRNELEKLLEEKTLPEEEYDDDWYPPRPYSSEGDYSEIDYIKMFESLKEE